jgi:hypothetical protein
MFPICTREMPGSKLGRAGTPNVIMFAWVSSDPPDKCRDIILNRVNIAHFQILSNGSFTIIHYTTL